MNRLTPIFFCLVFAVIAARLQAQAAADTSVLIVAQQMPEYPGGIDSLTRDISAKLRYPKVCVDSNIQGKVFVKFIVKKDGGISDLQIVKSPHPLLSVAALDAVITLKKFKPGKQQGQPVSVWYTIPVQFKIKSEAVSQNPSDIIVKNVADYFPGGAKAYDNFIQTNVVIPQQARNSGLDAIILVRCRLTAGLLLEPVEIMNSHKNIFDREVVRVIGLMPPVNDSIKRYNPKKVLMVVPVVFATSGVQATSIVPQNHYNEGVQFFSEGKYTAAVEAFNNAIRDNSRDGEAFYNRALTKVKLGQADACDDFIRAFSLGVLDAKEIVAASCK